MKEINSMNLQVIKYDVTQATLLELAKERDELVTKYKAEGDIEIIKTGKKKVAKLRNAIEKRRKEYKADALEYGRKVDAGAKEVVAPVLQIESVYDEIISEYDAHLEKLAREAQAKEDARIARIESEIDKYYTLGAIAFNMASGELKSRIEKLQEYLTTDFDFQEFEQKAESVYKDVENILKTALTDRLKHEEEQAALEKQRLIDEENRKKFEAEKAEFEKSKREAEAKFKAERDLIDLQRREEEKREHDAQMQKERDELEALRERDRLKRIEAEKQEAVRVAEIEREFEQKRIAQEKEDKIRNAAPQLLEALKSLYYQSRDFSSVVAEFVAMPCDSLQDKFPGSIYRIGKPIKNAENILNELNELI
jgi:hypothetical protein